MTGVNKRKSQDNSNNSFIPTANDNAVDIEIKNDEYDTKSIHTNDIVASAKNNTTNTKQRTSAVVSKRRIVDFSSGEEDFIPSHQRVTKKGGYAHTKSSRLKISQANVGNVPWNKGKLHDDKLKAAISAGVRARNHQILLHKCQLLNITVEQYEQYHKKKKLMRERLRKLRVTVKEYEMNKNEREKRQKIHSDKQLRAWKNIYLLENPTKTESSSKRSNSTNHSSSNDASSSSATVDNDYDHDSSSQGTSADEHSVMKGNYDNNKYEAEAMSNIFVDYNQSLYQMQKDKDDKNKITKQPNNELMDERIDVAASVMKTNYNASLNDDNTHFTTITNPNAIIPSLFIHDIIWTPHPLDGRNYKDNKSSLTNSSTIIQYQDICPYGGNGGLICCDICTANYSRYLSRTYQDIEEQIRLSKVNDEVRDMIMMLHQKKQQVQQTVEHVRTIPVPFRTDNNNNSKSNQLPDDEDVD